MNYEPTEELKKFMTQFITDEKVERFNSVIEKRTRYATIVLEDVYQAQNTNAVIRSCECFGIQDVHIIENKYNFEVVEDISKGSSKWLNIELYKEAGNNTERCLNKLKKDGYSIIGTSPHQTDVDLQEIDLNQKIAFVLGSELDGLSASAMQLCDGFMKIPMVGFTESLNISVCSAIILQNITARLWKTNLPWKLSEREQRHLYIEWCFEVVGRKEMLLQRFQETMGM